MNRTTRNTAGALTGALVMTAHSVAGAPVFIDLGTLPGGESSYGTGISADGSVVAGYTGYSPGGTRSFRWTWAGGMQDLVLPPGWTNASALGISADGAATVGGANGDGAVNFADITLVLINWGQVCR